MHLQKLSLITFLLSPSISFAFFCPTNFNQIDFGNTIDQVTQQCGKPDKQDTKEVKPEGAQEWSYFVTQTVATQTMTATQGTLKTQMSFDSSGKLINISVNGIGVGSTSICNGATIQLGDSKESVKAACGDPSYINHAEPAPGQQQKSTKVTEFTYNANPPVTLIFEDGVLKEKR